VASTLPGYVASDMLSSCSASSLTSSSPNRHTKRSSVAKEAPRDFGFLSKVKLLYQEFSDFSNAGMQKSLYPVFVGPIPPANQEHSGPCTDHPKTAPFSRIGTYNHPTTRKPVICQFRKNSLLISSLAAAVYKKVEIWHWIQCPIPNKQRADSFSSCQPFSVHSIFEVAHWAAI